MLFGVASAGCGGAPAAAPVAARGAAVAGFVKQLVGSQAEGAPVVSAGTTGVKLRPMPGGTFGVMVVLRNRTHTRLVLEDVRAVVPRGSFVRPLGAHLAPFFRCHPYCTRHFVMRGPYGPKHASPVHINAAGAAQAQLDFAIAGCSALRTASTEPIQKAVLVYRDSHGARYRQTIALRSSQLDLRPSGQDACRA